ncbi:glycosyltransferase family 4 protein [Mucilaginibacter gynuensis]|uniref:Glycosyltransferase family 4 protein n=1 Tax=Mucilaginibacter gynuensis TaxID=1302236 RepID=A0ABP8GP20_9SPHI
MEVLFVSHKYPPSIGGMEKQSFELIKGMSKYVKVHTIIHQTGKSKIRFFASLNRRILKMCREHPGIAVIHYNDGLMAAICLNHKGYGHLKRTVTLHGLDVVFPNNTYRRSVLPAYRNFDQIFAVSNATARACIERGIPAEKITVIKNGVDASIADCKPRPDLLTYLSSTYEIKLHGKRILMSIGRPVKRKGFSWFIDNVMPKMSDDFILLMVGPYAQKRTFADKMFDLLPRKVRRQVSFFLGLPTDTADIQKLLARPDISEKVKHLGKLPYEDMLQLLIVADGFVMPNIPVSGDIEGFGLVCLEACLCGAKVFASAIDGITDVITHGQNGYLLPARKADAWVTALSKLTNENSKECLQPEEIKAYTLKHFSWDKMVKQYLECFHAFDHPHKTFAVKD